jgi:transposase
MWPMGSAIVSAVSRDHQTRCRVTHTRPRANFAHAVFAGVDVSRDRLDLFVDGMKKTKRFANDQPGVAKLIESLEPADLAAVAVESTGGYERRLLHALMDHAVPAAHVNPLNVRHFARGMGYFAKTDAIDARVLAEFARTADASDRLRLLQRVGSAVLCGPDS